jgi:cysteine desulfuration protein SufE
MGYPAKLQAVIDMFGMFEPHDRTNMLLSYSDQFREVPREVAARPFDESHQVPQCESDAYAWAMKQADGTLKLYFAVENPSGVSARALAAILDKTLSGLTPEEIAQVDSSIVEKLFR